MRVDSYRLLLAQVRAGTGVAVLPCVLGDRLAVVWRLTAPEVLDSPMWVLTHPDLQQHPRIRAVMDGLVEAIRGQADASSGGLSGAG